MDTLLFPALAKKQFDTTCNSIIEQENQAFTQREKQIKKDCAKKNFRSLKSKYWLIFALALIFGGPIAALVVYLLRDKINAGLSGKLFLKADAIINEERKKHEENVKNIKNEYDIQYSEYVKLFENNAQELSVNYAESFLVTEVINWMCDGFYKTIDSADRRSYLEEIRVPFMFKTFKDKIECQLGIFDFEIKRCDELENPLEQTALARAIASSIQLNVTIKYPKDASGTPVVTDIFYDYNDDNVVATIVYTASNGNFKETRSWKANQ